VGDSRLRSDIEFALPDDRPLLRASGWEDVRFDLPRRFVAFLLDSGTHPLSDPWPAPVEALGDARLAARRLDPLPDGLRTAGTGIWLRAWSHTVLDEGERAAWHNLPAAGGRRYEWLAARTAAKEAASALTGRHPVDIAIDNDSAGRPVAAAPVHLSLTHAAGVAAALVSPDAAVGLDVEPLSRFSEVLEAAALTSEERALLASAPPAAADEWVLRLWCAKEAAAKAAGTGLAGTPRSLVIHRIDADGSVVVERSGPAAGPPFPLRVATGRDGDLVFASALFPIPKEAVP
jgi:phosphopantetheinyl transferase